MRKFDKLLKELKERYFCGISKRDEKGNTILHLAALYSNEEAIKLLVEKGAEVNAKNNKGETPLHKAANTGKIRNVKAIIEAGGNVNARDNDDATPLHRAAMLGTKVNVEVLKEVMKVSDYKRGAPERFATIAEMLIEAGCNIYAQDKHELTAEFYAKIKGRAKVMMVFLKYKNVSPKVEAEKSVRQEILSLSTKTSQELRKMYEEESQAKAPPYRREYFIKWLAYRLQEKEYGGLSEKATKTLDYLVEQMRQGKKINPSLLPAGTRIIKQYRGEEYEVTVSKNGYIYRGKPYKSLSAIANEITGTRWNGLKFFNVKNAN